MYRLPKHGKISLMTEQQTHILIVDDDKEILSLLSDFLRQYQFTVHTATQGDEMFSVLAKHNIDLIILDLMLPGDDGITLCRKIRADSRVPIIMLTAIGDEADRIVGLEMGADDYVAKPFSPRELLARIKAVLRRSTNDNQEQEQKSASSLTFEGWELNLANRRFTSPDGLEVSLRTSEFELLEAFANHRQKVLSRDQLMDMTRDRITGPYDRSIDILISRLRQKMEVDPKNPQLIKTVRGGGYLFTPEVSFK